MVICDQLFVYFFFFNDTATTEIYTLSLHDALPICDRRSDGRHGSWAQGHADLGDRIRRRNPRLGERGRRLRRHRPDAGNVQAPQAGALGQGRRRPRRPPAVSRTTTDLLYLVTIVTFILALRFLSRPDKACWGNRIGAAGMLLAIAVTFAQSSIVSYWEIVLAMIIGGGFGAVAARRVKMTAMPQMVALFNGVGGGAAALVSWAEFHRQAPAAGHLELDIAIAIMLSALIGAISFAGSMVAFAKLQELIQGRPITYPGQQVVNALVLGSALAAGIAIAAGAEEQWLMWVLL